jgi:hypothetical protein
MGLEGVLEEIVFWGEGGDGNFGFLIQRFFKNFNNEPNKLKKVELVNLKSHDS